jgi:hypothetical protein
MFVLAMLHAACFEVFFDDGGGREWCRRDPEIKTKNRAQTTRQLGYAPLRG